LVLPFRRERDSAILAGRKAGLRPARPYDRRPYTLSFAQQDLEGTMPGIHHVTAISGAPERNLDFYGRVLGLRLVKKTVNFDDPGTYHLYYGDHEGTPARSSRSFRGRTPRRDGLAPARRRRPRFACRRRRSATGRTALSKRV